MNCIIINHGLTQFMFYRKAFKVHLYLFYVFKIFHSQILVEVNWTCQATF